MDLTALIDTSHTPGIQYIAVDATGVIASYAAGWADIARKRPMDPATTMMAYSMSKTVTAAAVLQLVDRGRLNVDHAVATHLPDSPYGPEVTIRELLSHTGGLPNPIPLRWVHPAAAHDRFDEAAALAAVLRAHPRLSRRPGARYAYSNIGYWLLGRIVERVSGMTFASYVTTHLLNALAIAPGELGYTVTDPDRHAAGYLEKYSAFNLMKRWLIDPELIGGYEERWLRIQSHYLNGPAFGGLVGAAGGFGRFLQDQLRPHSVLFGDAARGLFYEPQRTRKGAGVPMTLGWHVGQVNGAVCLYKEGGGGGFHCMMRLYPDRGIGSVVMTNATASDVAGCLNTVDAAVIDRVRSR